MESSKTIFTDINKVPAQYPWLAENEKCDVLVVGGGVSGCLTAHTLAKKGVDVVIISSRPIGMSDCLCDSGRLDYQNELFLSTLANTLSREDAVYVYNKYNEALIQIEELSESLDDFSFEKRDSLIYTNENTKLNDLHAEYLIRKHNGFDVSFVERKDTLDSYSFQLDAGILAKEQAAVLDPYLFCHALIKDCLQLGVRVYENTSCNEFSHIKDGILTEVSNGFSVTSSKVVLAIGAKQREFLSNASLKKTEFFVVTNPAESFNGIKDRAIVKSLDKNITVHADKENRVIASGLNCTVFGAKQKLSKAFSVDRLYNKKYTELKKYVQSTLCGMPDMRFSYCFTGEYASTKNNLPIIGESKDFPQIYFNMPSSMNGILSSCIGADIILKLYLKENVKNPFSP